MIFHFFSNKEISPYSSAGNYFNNIIILLLLVDNESEILLKTFLKNSNKSFIVLQTDSLDHVERKVPKYE
jgi:hypothetical protein